MSIDQIHQLRIRSNQFVADFQMHVGEVVEHNERLLQLNKAQLKASKTSKGGALINSRTGSSKYSPAYAKKKGYSNPDLFVNGYFYKEMDIVYNEPSEYVISSYADFTKYLVEMYSEDIFGINDKKKAQAIVMPELQQIYINTVLK